MKFGPSSSPFNAIGAALWVAVWTSVGYFSGSHINSIYNTGTRYDTYLGIAVGAIIIAWIARAIWRRHSRRNPTISLGRCSGWCSFAPP